LKSVTAQCKHFRMRGIAIQSKVSVKRYSLDEKRSDFLDSLLALSINGTSLLLVMTLLLYSGCRGSFPPCTKHRRVCGIGALPGVTRRA